MRKITWQVQDDVRDEHGKHQRGPVYELAMSESDQRIYRGAEAVAMAVVFLIALVVGMTGVL